MRLTVYKGCPIRRIRALIYNQQIYREKMSRKTRGKTAILSARNTLDCELLLLLLLPLLLIIITIIIITQRAQLRPKPDRLYSHKKRFRKQYWNNKHNL